MSTDRLTRRRFLLLAAATVPAAGAAGLLWARRGPESRVDTFAGRATAFIDDLGAARRLGRSYLEANPAEAGERQLERLLVEASSEWRAARGPVDVETMRALVRRDARRDFAEDRLVAVDGWYLARTEARLAALSLYA
jgi:hypothetical protein